jgi:hypothetical protein
MLGGGGGPHILPALLHPLSVRWELDPADSNTARFIPSLPPSLFTPHLKHTGAITKPFLIRIMVCFIIHKTKKGLVYYAV